MQRTGYSSISLADDTLILRYFDLEIVRDINYLSPQSLQFAFYIDNITDMKIKTVIEIRNLGILGRKVYLHNRFDRSFVSVQLFKLLHINPRILS